MLGYNGSTFQSLNLEFPFSFTVHFSRLSYCLRAWFMDEVDGRLASARAPEMSISVTSKLNF